MIIYIVMVLAVLTVVLCLFFVRMKTNLKRLYLMVVSIVSVVGVTIAGGILIYTGLQDILISDEERLMSNNYRRERECDNNDPTIDQKIENISTDADRQSCIEEQENQALLEHSFDTKQAYIGSIARGLVALLLFVTHAIPFLRSKRDD
jgi:glucan phosphoethanolaminetransferase (alkaline phosphatase superfamily)